ncbi:ankyrin repeat-containing protein ITN1-like [Vitis riparia]|uniref:ankyrin repeat-containing protein ITN1-like n=1 Tax=Vitis riparia TaxID=96939 RepID=UPI00155A84A2|nr:ankyrin repeat-containing protein ITN1-like [Vitis riparia]
MQNPALQTKLLSFEKVKKACQVHVTKPLNKENKTAEELFVTRNEKLHREAKEWLMRSTENCTLLSVFIATVAFAAAYTVPGGPDQNTGIPILNCKPFFVVFIIADVISLTLALTSVGIFLAILQSSFLLEDFKKYLFEKLIQGIICLMLSVLMMAVAFGATIILIMKHNWKKAVWHVVAFLPVPIFFLSYSPLRSIVLLIHIKKLLKEVLKSIKGVALVALIILLGLIIRLCRACMELFNTVAKACEFIICKPVRWICCQQTAALCAEV